MEVSVITLLIVAVLAANLPFVSNRLACIKPIGRKHFGWQLLELVVLFLLVGGLARLMEARLGPVHEQHWQFYVTTFALFLVFAFPGFVMRHFWKRPHSG
ncbi:DUF2818 family protein [Crenobacter sp. SG2305]|uniref:DUF2818 family protein n=1 Tax=Crenobacter oryzisoli TaxID=3056844 RepID=UPI0025AB4DE9|nr:DUF2818 family protein [Crenobacter sp. SG2305]MDN0084628.1 DUF2818 family protein [Crenobacter sp. SG2305]